MNNLLYRRRFHKSGFGKIIDLGLPSGTKWASTNIGANSPYEEGLYFSWGETTGYKRTQVGIDKMFSWTSLNNDYIFGPIDYSATTNYGMTKYNRTDQDQMPTLNLEDDAAELYCGSQWCLPTKEQFDELLDDRYVTKTWDSSKKVLIITSKQNGQKLILFAGGYGDNGQIENYNNIGAYWSRSVNTSHVDEAWQLRFNNGQFETRQSDRYMGLCIRPVMSQQLTFCATQDNSSIRLMSTYLTSAQFQYSLDNGKTYNNYKLTYSRIDNVYGYFGPKIYLNNSDTIRFRGVFKRLGNNGSSRTQFYMTGKFNASGDVTSLLNGIGGDARLYSATFWGLFSECQSLLTAPKLPSKNAFSSCYVQMFKGCTNLKVAPELPSTNLSIQCYMGMFSGCTSLIQAPQLPATSIPERGYNGMFKDCTSLVIAPDLPAMSILSYGYADMFYNCTSLIKAPELPITILSPDSNMCYANMFYNCSNLNYIKAQLLTQPSNEYTSNWVYGVAETGTFVKNPDAEWDVVGVNGVPEGWVVNYDTSRCLTFKATQNNSTIKITKTTSGSPQLPTANLSYSLDNGDTWLTYTLNSVISLQKDQTVKFRGTNDYLGDYYNGTPRSHKFVMTGQFESFGDVTSLLNNKGGDFALAYERSFANLFYQCTSLISAPNLPSTTLSSYCYVGMFSGCTSLRNAPILPAKTLTSGCYYSMFQNCEQLNYIMCLATDNSADRCTRSWLNNVSPTGTFIQEPDVIWADGASGIPTEWTKAGNGHELTFITKYGNSSVKFISNVYSGYNNAVLEYSIDYGITWEPYTLNTEIYLNNPYESVKFRGNNQTIGYSEYNFHCFKGSGIIDSSGDVTSLLNNIGGDVDISNKPYCFCRLFTGFSSLMTAPNLPSTQLGEYCYYYMFNMCKSLITAPELPATTLANSCYSCMFNECASLTNGPQVLASTNAPTGCYSSMFYRCSKLVQAPEILATTMGQSACSNMFSGCTSLTQAPYIRATELGTTCFSYMFNYCSNILSHHFASINESYDVLYSNSSCQSFTIDAVVPPTINNSTFSGLKSDCIIYVPAESVSAYKAAQYWSARSAYIQAIPTE